MCVCACVRARARVCVCVCYIHFATPNFLQMYKINNYYINFSSKTFLITFCSLNSRLMFCVEERTIGEQLHSFETPR